MKDDEVDDDVDPLVSELLKELELEDAIDSEDVNSTDESYEDREL